MNVIASFVARGTVRRGSSASSPKMAVASKPMKDMKTNMKPIPTAPLNISVGLSELRG